MTAQRQATTMDTETDGQQQPRVSMRGGGVIGDWYVVTLLILPEDSSIPSFLPFFLHLYFYVDVRWMRSH